MSLWRVNDVTVEELMMSLLSPHFTYRTASEKDGSWEQGTVTFVMTWLFKNICKDSEALIHMSATPTMQCISVWSATLIL